MAPQKQGVLTVDVEDAFTPRCWFLDQTKNNLVQLQRDKLFKNWRKLAGNEPYPRYSKLIQEFSGEWETFLAFLREHDIAQPKPNQCELTYVNHLIPDDQKGLGDPSTQFTFFRPQPSASFLPPAEVFTWSARFQLPDGRGRLHVQANPAFRARDMKLVLLLNLTARGAPAGHSTEQFRGWFDLAHEWIVRAFEQITDPSLHKLWGKKHEG